MPTYEYKCNNCGHAFEKFHSIMAPPIKKCPACGKNTVERLIGTGAGLIFKGSGFYITDYRDSAYKEKAKAESGGGATETKTDAPAPAASASTAESKGGSGAEAKPAAKAVAETKPAKAEPKPQAKSSSSKPKSRQ